MGKQKRARQKFHLASIRWQNETEKAKLMDAEDGPGPQGSPNMDLSKATDGLLDNVFKGMDIDVSQLKTSLLADNDDAVSVKSIAKSLKSVSSAAGKHMKKIEKRKLRHNLFIQKIDAIYQDMKQKKSYKKMKGAGGGQLLEESKSELDGLNLGELSDAAAGESKEAKIKDAKSGFGKKLKGIEKTKKRKMEMLKDINIFKKLISETTRSSCPLDAITSKVEEKVFDEQL